MLAEAAPTASASSTKTTTAAPSVDANTTGSCQLWYVSDKTKYELYYYADKTLTTKCQLKYTPKDENRAWYNDAWKNYGIYFLFDCAKIFAAVTPAYLYKYFLKYLF
jgi:hypothetical protein